MSVFSDILVNVRIIHPTIYHGVHLKSDLPFVTRPSGVIDVTEALATEVWGEVVELIECEVDNTLGEDGIVRKERLSLRISALRRGILIGISSVSISKLKSCAGIIATSIDCEGRA